MLKAIDVKDVKSHLSDTDVVLGENVRRAIHTVQKESQHRVIVAMLSFYKSTAANLSSRLPLDNELLQNVTHLQPTFSVLPESTKAVYSITQKMPRIADDYVLQIVNKWNAYYVDAEAVRMSADAEGKRVDHYWREILLLKACDGCYKFENMTKLIKTVLLLPHGNADVERGFSINNDVLNRRQN